MFTERLFPSRHRCRFPHATRLEANGLYLPVYSCTRPHGNLSQSAPRAIIQILITGTQIFGKALYAAGTQAVKSTSSLYRARDGITYLSCIDAKHQPDALSSDVAGVGKATSGSFTDKLTREHRLTLDEAHLILNTKKEDGLEQILTVSLFTLSLICSRAIVPFPRIMSICSSRIRPRKQRLPQNQWLGSVFRRSITRITFNRRLSGRGNVSKPNTNYRAHHRNRYPRQHKNLHHQTNDTVSPLAKLYRWPHVYHTPTLMTVMVGTVRCSQVRVDLNRYHRASITAQDE